MPRQNRNWVQIDRTEGLGTTVEEDFCVVNLIVKDSAFERGGQPFVLCPETSDEKVTTGKMGYDQ